MEQNSQEWHEARRGKITASNAHKIMGARGLGKTGETYIYELVAHDLGAYNDEIDAFALRYGKDMEPIAIDYLSKAINVDVDSAGFITAEFNDTIGFSPDGFITQGNRGLEIKCPLNVENHVKYMTIKTAKDLKAIEPKYYWQVMFSMYCSKKESWLFASFNPKFEGANRMHAINIKADNTAFALIEERVKQATELKESIKERLKL